MLPNKNPVDSIQRPYIENSSRKLVLIADDDITNRLILQGILNKKGYESIHAENGKEAVEIFLREQPDIVLMDVMMLMVTLRIN